MFRHLEKFEEIISRALLLMMAAVVLLTTIELGWILVKDVLTPPVFLLEIGEILELFGMFLLVLIGIELMHSVKIFIKRREIHLEAMLVVALVAVARKVIVLEPKELAPEAVLGLAVLALALTIGYYLVRRSGREGAGDNSQG
ncbi:MAG: phosphate-starvation-inducible PsiE family protein [Gammaproteobacteria bacterium]|nr:phosphate-starvation-inducible PsiE family protein [Gammaproteobacteria bacterium]